MTRSSTQDDTTRDWSAVAAICREVESGLATLVTQIMDDIRRDQPAAYVNVSRAEHEAWIHEQAVLLLAGLAARRPPTATETDHARALGRRRAQQGLPVEVVLGAYHRAYQYTWNALAARARPDEPEQTSLVLELVDLTLIWLRRNTSAFADGHAEAARSRDEIRIGLGHQFLDALYAGRATAEETEMLARALGFDPDGLFQAICCPAPPAAPEYLDHLRRRLRDNGGAECAMVRGRVLVVVSQGLPEQRVIQALDGLDGQPTAGLGLPRPGLVGAAESVIDAERALGVAQGAPAGEVVRFSSSWLLATLSPQLDRLRPLLDSGRATEQAHLCEAVRAYAGHGFSITASAEALHVHPNTVKYRLDRWQHLTGWDPRTLDGLQRSLLSIALAERQRGEQSAYAVDGKDPDR
ncbi:PucR family transcriptional regulator [Micromonospora musae]|uniref:PucR family transcriptional regulator n=1 Tax=Micromonospora musae TaxID=1894970 RepID=A0ABX9RHE4_9ACTN|nr:helix-turn-helix domain-containing protein [Micromonospora musae]RKN22068.1 PucR family transcriptional regulator [Micromonospora musae]